MLYSNVRLMEGRFAFHRSKAKKYLINTLDEFVSENLIERTTPVEEDYSAYRVTDPKRLGLVE